MHAYNEWGTDCLARLRGMFAFAIWDARRESPVSGARPVRQEAAVPYSHVGTLLFASEIKALLQFPGVVPRVNHSALGDYFRYRYVPAPDTLFADVHKLMPGSYMSCDAEGTTESRFYLPPDGRLSLSSRCLR